MDPDRQRQLYLRARAEAEAELELEQEAALSRAMDRGASPPQAAEPSLNWRGAAETATGGLANIFNGLTLNYGDEILGAGAGGIDYLANKFSSEGDPNLGISDFVRHRTDQVRDLRNDFKNQDAVAGAFTEIGGSVLNPLSFMSKAKNAGKLEQIARATATGATQGGIYGSGEEGSMGDRLQNAGEGALWGGAFGGTLQSVLGPGLGYLKDAGGRLQRAAYNIRQADVKKAANTVAKGAPNPLIESFDNLIDEGQFKGVMAPAPAVVRDRLAARAGEINDELGNVLSEASSKGGTALPKFQSTQNYLKTLKGSDYKAANTIYQDEVADLIDTLDNGGTLADWQIAKRSLQQNSKYGTETAALENEIRTRIASDIKRHIENVADEVIPEQAGAVKALNNKLSQGQRVDEVLKRGEVADIAADPEVGFRQKWRTSGGYGVPMMLASGAGAGGAEYGRSGSPANALAAFAAGATLMSRTGKFKLGSAFRTAAKTSPAVLTKAGVPFIVKSIARENRQETMTPGDFFKAGASGIDAYKAQVGNADEALDILHKEAATSFRNFAAPNGTIDQDKANKWLSNNREALSRLPDLRAQLSKPEIAQRLVKRHFNNAEALPQPEVDKNAFREYVQVEPSAFVSKVLQSPNPVHNLQQTVSYLKKDREAVNGLRRAAVEYLNTSDPMAYAKNRAVMEKGKLFTISQMRVADALYGGASSPGDDQSTLKALTEIARGGFLGSAPYGKYIEHIEPIIKSVPPEQIRAKLETALYDPLLARDLMNKANSKNMTRAIEVLFKDELAAASPPSPEPTPPTPVIKQSAVTSKKSFPTPRELMSSKAPGQLQNRTIARDAYEVADPTKKKVNFLGEDMDKKALQELISQQSPETQARISTESAGNPYALSPKGAQGLAQLMPATALEIAAQLGEEYLPLTADMTPEEQQASIEQNIRFGDYYYKKQLERFKDPKLAWAAYNAGPEKVRKAMVRAGSTHWDTVAKYLPAETRNYVPKVLAAKTKFA